MSSTRVLVIANNLAAVYVWHGKQLHGPLEFAAGEEGYAALAAHLKGDAPIATEVVVDVIEEEFRSETAPHVLGRDHAALLARRLEQAFRLTPYRMAVVQGRQATGKREDELLLSAITNPDLLKPWLDVLRQCKTPLRGIYSISQLYGHLLKLLSDNEKRALIITRQKHGGMRQAFYLDQKMKMSRLTPAPNTDYGAHAAQLLTEVEKSQRYLSRLKLIDRDDVLTIHCVSDGGEMKALRETCRDTPTLRFQFHSLESLTQKAGGVLAHKETFADTLLLHLLKHTTPPRDYSTAIERRYDTYRRARLAMHGLSAALVLGAIAWSGVNIIDARLMLEFNGTADRLSDDIQVRYERVKREIPQTPVSADSLRTGVELARALNEQRTLPQGMLQALGAGLTAFPEIRVQRLDWVVTRDPAAIGDAADAQTDQTQEAQTSEQNTSSTDLYQVAQLNGSLTSFDGDYVKAFETVNRLVAQLKKTENMVSVEAVKMPLDTRSSAVLQGKAGVEEKDSAADFILKAVLKVKREIR